MYKKIKSFLLLSILALAAIFMFQRWTDIAKNVYADIVGPSYITKDNLWTLQSRYEELLKIAAMKPKKILLWSSDFPQTLSYRCGSCNVTTDKNSINDVLTKAVSIMFNQVEPTMMPPRHLRPDQLYVWQCMESPQTLVHKQLYNFTEADLYQFNATMTHRRNSDVHRPYSLINPKKCGTNPSLFSNPYRKFGVAVVSNCNKTSGAKARHALFSILSIKIPELELYGRCFDDIDIPREKMLDKFHEFLSQYKFYFAFENSYHCQGYITEKLNRNAIRTNTLPIVWGPERKDYEDLGYPPRSFIHVDDFASVDGLVRYLKYLHNNLSAYLEHFEWRMHPETNPLPDNSIYCPAVSFCQLCRIINGINIDDVFRPDYDPRSPHRPLLPGSVTPRSVKLKEWILDDNRDCIDEYEIHEFYEKLYEKLQNED